MNLNSIADNFEVSRPAISNHIRILHECGIIVIEQAGRERYCKIQSENLKEVADWVEPFRQLWEQLQVLFEGKGETTEFTFNVIHPSEEYCKQQEKMGFYNGWGTAFERLNNYLLTLSTL